GPKAGGSAPPVGVTHTVVGANANYTVSITNPSTPQGTTIYHEISYSPVISFKSNLTTTLPPFTETTKNIPAPGSNQFFRLRSSFDRKTWTNYQLSSTSPIDAGLIESGTMAPGATFNQSNFAVATSEAVGSGASVFISGTGGPLTPYTAVKGSMQSSRPSATIIGNTFGPSEFIGWDGTQFQLKGTLADVLADNLEPVGKVAIGSGAPGGGGTAGGNGARLTAV